MLTAFAILEIVALVLLVTWNTFFEWKIAELVCFWHRSECCFKKIERKYRAKPNKAMIFREIR